MAVLLQAVAAAAAAVEAATLVLVLVLVEAVAAAGAAAGAAVAVAELQQAERRQRVSFNGGLRHHVVRLSCVESHVPGGGGGGDERRRDDPHCMNRLLVHCDLLSAWCKHQRSSDGSEEIRERRDDRAEGSERLAHLGGGADVADGHRKRKGGEEAHSSCTAGEVWGLLQRLRQERRAELRGHDIAWARARRLLKLCRGLVWLIMISATQYLMRLREILIGDLPLACSFSLT
eukprot:COSAG06_NODE_1953_length_7994_cov_40.573583_3_plen_232_part_00